MQQDKCQLRYSVLRSGPDAAQGAHRDLPKFLVLTRIALSTPEERLRPHVLLAVRGVGWPVASVILHICHADPYPILDSRALWSASADVPSSYTFAFWEAWTKFSREAASKAGVSMRALDRALWQYSKENQRG